MAKSGWTAALPLADAWRPATIHGPRCRVSTCDTRGEAGEEEEVPLLFYARRARENSDGEGEAEEREQKQKRQPWP